MSNDRLKELNKADIYRILGVLGNVSTSTKNYQEAIRNVDVTDLLDELGEYNLPNINKDIVMYEYFVRTEQYKLIDKYFDFGMGASITEDIVLFAPLQSDTILLSSFKNMSQSILSSKIALLRVKGYNESEDAETAQTYDREYDSFEQAIAKIPSSSISVTFLDIPAKDDNIKYYIDNLTSSGMVIEDKNTNRDGYIVLALDKSTIKKHKEYLSKRLNISVIYKSDNKMCDRFIVVGTFQNTPLNSHSANQTQLHARRIIDKGINSESEFHIDYYGQLGYFLPTVDFNSLENSIAIANEQVSNKTDMSNDNWKWIKDITNYEKSKNDTINKPTDLTSGEVANLLASGIINGEMKSKNDFHIVTGGVQHKNRVNMTQEKNKEGELVHVKQTLLYSQPYLNVLISNDKGTYIKELGGGIESENTIY